MIHESRTALDPFFSRTNTAKKPTKANPVQVIKKGSPEKALPAPGSPQYKQVVGTPSAEAAWMKGEAPAEGARSHIAFNVLLL
jgi:hypothetical protein